jgi:outer membrane biosynthesis protein TonB
MRLGLAVSLIGHAAIIGFGFVAFPDARPFAVTEIEALPVDLVEIADETDLLEGDKQAEEAPEETPQPKPQVEAETPSPEPAEKPAEKPVETAREPTPPPPPPEPEPEEVAALPEPEPPTPPPPPAEAAEPLPEAEPEPEPEPVDARVPRARPTPPKRIVQPKPPEPTRTVAEQEEPEQEFNPEDIAALLNKQDPAGGGDPNPVPEPQTLGSIDGRPEAAMTQSELAALQARLYGCWSPPVAVREAASLVVEVRITLLPDGSLAGDPQLLSIGSVSSPLSQIAAEAAIRAVVQCAPFGDILRPEKYALWQQIDFVFDPRHMLGG